MHRTKHQQQFYRYSVGDTDTDTDADADTDTNVEESVVDSAWIIQLDISCCYIVSCSVVVRTSFILQEYYEITMLMTCIIVWVVSTIIVINTIFFDTKINNEAVYILLLYKQKLRSLQGILW